MKIKRKLLVMLCALIFLCIGSVCIVAIAEDTSEQSKAIEQVLVDEFLDNVYKVGDVVEMPLLIEDGKEYQRLVCDPDGNGYTSDSLTLDKPGIWKLLFANESIEKGYEFKVYPALASINGIKSEIGIGKAAEHMKYDAQGRSGIYTKVAYNESVTFNQIIDLNGKKETETFLEFSVFPDTYGIEDASILVLTLSDVEDPNNQIQIHLRAEKYTATDTWPQRVVYIRSGAPNQGGIGLTKADPGIYTYRNQGYKTYWGNDWDERFGTHVIFSLRGVGAGMNESNIGKQRFALAMNYEEKQLVCYAYNNGDTTSGPFLLNDFDAEELHGVNLWEGFSSGKCKLTVSAKKYVAPAFTMLITKLGDKTEFDKEYIVNDIPPQIEVTNADMDTVSNILIGSPFIIPKAVAYDVTGAKTDVAVNVYTGYGTGTQTKLDISSGAFVPTQKRTYTLEYISVDSWGNYGIKTYPLSAVSINEFIPFKVSVESSSVYGKIGQTIELRVPEIAENFVGRYDVEVEARLGAETISLGKYSVGDEIVPFFFTPMKSGNWIIVYKYSDLASQGMVFYTLQVEGGGKSYFTSEAAVPKCLIIGATYQVPELYGYECSGTECILTKAKLFISSSPTDYSASEITGETFTWTENFSKVYFTYELSGTTKQYEVAVSDVGYKTQSQSVTNYFYGYTGEPIVQEKGTVYSIANQDGIYELGFANKVQAYNFRADLTVPVTAEYSKISLILSDTTDLSNTLKLSYIITKTDSIYYSINNGINKPITLSKGEEFNFRYDAIKKSVTFGTSEETVYYAMDGRNWEGFTQNEIWVSILLEDVFGTNTQVEVNGLNNQRFYNAESFETLDMMPEFYQNISDISPLFNIGATIVVPPALASDVLAVGTTVTLKATAPDGSIIKTVDGIPLDNVSGIRSYEVLLDSYGDYIFAYTVKDDLGRINKRGLFQFSVTDTTPPAVDIGAHSNIAKIGSKLVLADIVITDNKSVTENCSYAVYIQCPDYNFVALSSYEESGFTFTSKGNYKVFYYVYDEAGNVTLVSYEIFVQ